MRDTSRDRLDNPADRPAGPPAARAIAAGEGWHVGEVICRLGPHDRPFEERHENVTIAAVVEGSFQYRSDAGTALLYPGAVLLGNAESSFECGHEHGTGDRCIAFQFAPEFFAEIAAAVTGSHRFRFPAAMVPAIRDLPVPFIELEAMASGGGRAARGGGPAARSRPIAMDEMAVRLAEIVLGAVADSGRSGSAPSARDQRRISHSLRYIEEHALRPLGLGELAGVACMSKYHFLRTFRRIVGVTPYRFLLGVRMRRAALMLRTTPDPVAAIAFDAGFGDLSTFNGRFRDLFGVSPGEFRRERKSVDLRASA